VLARRTARDVWLVRELHQAGHHRAARMRFTVRNLREEALLPQDLAAQGDLSW
jgi:hypothetical protein